MMNHSVSVAGMTVASNNPIGAANPASAVASIGMTDVAALNQPQFLLQQQLQLQPQQEPSRKKPRHNSTNTDDDGKPLALPQINNKNTLNSASTHICQNSNNNEIPNLNLNLSAPLNVALSATTEARSVLNLASAIVQDASGLVDDITDLCRFDQGQVLVIEKEAVKVREICTEALTKVQFPIGSQGLVEVVLDIQEGAPGRTMTDRSVLKRCLSLLLNFAVDAAANAVVSRKNAAAAGGVGAQIGDGGKGKVILSISDVASEQHAHTGKSACKISVFYTNPPDSNDAHANNILGESGHGCCDGGQNAGLNMLGDCYNKGMSNDSNEFGLGSNAQQHSHVSHSVGMRTNNLWRNNHHLAASGGSMMRRIHLRESIESGMTSCRRDKLGLGLSLLYHLVGAQGSDLRYEMVASEPTTSSSLSVTHGRSARVTLPSMSNFWFLLPMSLDFPDRLPAERIVKEDLTDQIQNLPVHTPFPRRPSYSSVDANELEVQQPLQRSSKPTQPVSLQQTNDNVNVMNANLIGTTIYTHIGAQPVASATSTNAHVEPLTIQVATAAVATTTPGVEPSAPAAPTKFYPGVSPGSRPLVLVVEDTDVSASLLCMHLRKLNCTSHRAENGEVALEMLRSAPTPNMYSLILMDLRMPVMDGFEATTIIKGSNASNVPVVALTGETSEENRRKCEEIGFDDYKTKPLKRPQLMELLNKFVPGYQSSP